MKINKVFLLLVATVFSFVANAQFLEGTNIPADTTYNLARVYRQTIDAYPYIIPVEDSVPKGVVAERNIVYTTLPDTRFGDRDLHLDLFRPESPGKYPALIMVHGGGWRAGNKSLQVPMAEMIAEKGYVTIAVEYQLSLEAKYPAAVHNIKAAIRWMRAHAEEYSIDPDRIAISGCSAGGHLAALVGMTNGIERFEGEMGNNGYSSDVQAIVDIDGVINFMAPKSLNLERSSDSPDIEWLGGSFVEVPGIWREASSGYWVNENSVPILFLTSGFPRFTAGKDELIGTYQEFGIYHEAYQFKVDVHPFWLFHPWADMAVNYMVDFLNKTLK
ncbi:alpha/beta hydrolase [Mangrovibacterium diazotrophicum]|uniref:Acetyl esterase/lipase n=1 Tax=Mangrovibacterium diazotrophicum TaxID=1261403 RepID=A0A419W4G5_9BACT|nr:alpha/beta hydrolase [Mangrovibacterium diazotrophicum]RKD90326.1 acetyl esterase/lipase [Mangrovibacterium diazotrophicum]